MSKFLKKIENVKPFYKLLFVVLLLLFGFGVLFQQLHNHSPDRALPMNEVKGKLALMERNVERQMEDVAKWLDEKDYERIRLLAFEKLPHTILVYKGDSLLFWSDNEIEPKQLNNYSWRFRKLSNVYALTRILDADNYRIVAYLPLKYNYPYENEDLQNEFVPALNLHKDITFANDSPAGKYAYFDRSGNYLFSFELPDYPVYNETYALLSMLFYLLGFLLLFYLFSHLPLILGWEHVTLKRFAAMVLGLSVPVFLMLWSDRPHTFFSNNLFTPFDFASASFLSTLMHVTLLSLLLFSLAYLFSFFLEERIPKGRKGQAYLLVLLLLPSLFYLLIYRLLYSVVYSSSLDINMLQVENLTILAVYNYLIFLTWGVTLYFLHNKSRSILLKKISKRRLLLYELPLFILMIIVGHYFSKEYGRYMIAFYLLLILVLYLPHFFKELSLSGRALAFWLFIFALFVSRSVFTMHENRKIDKYKTLAENYYLNNPHEEDKLATVLLEDLDKSITWDARLKKMVQNPDSIVAAGNYVNDLYMRGFWGAYKVRLFSSSENPELSLDYEDAVFTWGEQVRNTHFYIMDIPNSDMSFLASYNMLDSRGKQIDYFLEFYPRSYQKSYSFPDLLLETRTTLSSQQGVSNARYTYRNLVSSSGKYGYPKDAGWIQRGTKNFHYQDFEGFRHYIYSPDVYEDFVLSEKHNSSSAVYFFYFAYVALFFLVVSYLIRLAYRLIHQNRNISNTFSSRFLYTFTLLLLLSFAAIFYVSFSFMQKKYEDEHVNKLEDTKIYIQHALQEQYAWQIELDSTLRNELIFDLQDLSYTYQTDIHVYDNRGMLVASSQMPLFNRGLVGSLISPMAYFSNLENVNQYEHIGQLEYLTGYTDFYNMDYLPIGYIAVPQFFSEDQMRAELEDLLSAIVHIFMLIILLFFLLSVFIGRQLSAPLAMLEQSLKEMRVGHSMKKIEYKPRDEIGQLVDQYNNTVEELEHNIRLLARSERETAWKTMARQIAHEINNPLTPMKLSLQQLQRRKEMNDPEFDVYFEKSSVMLIEQIENLSRIAGSFSNFAKLPETKHEQVDVAQILTSVVTLFENSNDSIELTQKGIQEGVYVMGDKEQLIQVFNNLLKNAQQAIPTDVKGKIKLDLRKEKVKVYISVTDNGKGISDDIKEQLFMPNFTTKSTGMGLGLAISRNIVELMGGEISFETELGRGTTFTVELPRIRD